VKKCLENSPSDALDLAVEFEHFREHENIDDFIESLQKQHSVSTRYSNAAIEDMALTELQEHAENLRRQKSLRKTRLQLTKTNTIFF